MRIAIVLTLMLSTSAALAGTAAENFRSAVERKVAPPFGTIGTGKYKALCVCNGTEQVGVLESFNGIPNLGVTCTVPSFSANGDYNSGSACYDWTPLTK